MLFSYFKFESIVIAIAKIVKQYSLFCENNFLVVEKVSSYCSHFYVSLDDETKIIKCLARGYVETY